MGYRQRNRSSRKGTKTLCYDSLIYIFLLYKHIDLNIKFLHEIKKILFFWNKKKCMDKNIKFNITLAKDNFNLLYNDPKLDDNHKKLLEKIITKIEKNK